MYPAPQTLACQFKSICDCEVNIAGQNIVTRQKILVYTVSLNNNFNYWKKANRLYIS